NASVSGSGVLIYNAGSNGTYGAINLSGNGNISLTPAPTGTYAGMLFFQARDNARGLSLTGNGIVIPGGLIYAPSAGLTVSGNGQFQGTSIVDTLTLSGHTVFNQLTSSGHTVYTPAQVRSAYDVNALGLDGTGQTIAIVDAYATPNLYQT